MKKVFESAAVQLLVICVLGILSLIYAYFNWDQVASVLFSQVPLWTTIVVGIVALLVAWLAWLIHRRRSGGPQIAFVSSRSDPEILLAQGMIDMFGVKWKILFGYAFLPRGEPYAVAKGPYCPRCTFEMETEQRGLLVKGPYWKCVPCHKFYRCPEESSAAARDLVQKQVESEYRKRQTSPGSTPP